MAASLLPDLLWELIERLLPLEPSKPKGGRPQLPDRRCLAGILFVLRSGVPREMLPKVRSNWPSPGRVRADASTHYAQPSVSLVPSFRQESGTYVLLSHRCASRWLRGAELYRTRFSCRSRFTSFVPEPELGERSPEKVGVGGSIRLWFSQISAWLIH
jgi:hypothetical protein